MSALAHEREGFFFGRSLGRGSAGRGRGPEGAQARRNLVTGPCGERAALQNCYARAMLRFRIPPEEAAERARRVTLLLLDCDGVMTDGTILLTAEGEEIKRFNI